MDREVLVVGGGIAGLAVACALHQRAVACRVLERSERSPDGGLGINLPGNAIVALHQLGLGDDLPALGIPVRRREYRDGRGRLLFAVDEEGFWGSGAQPRCVLRSALHAALRRLIPASSVSLASEVVRLHEVGDRVEVVTAGGPCRADLLVGADGVHSLIRTLVSGDRAARPALLAKDSWRFVGSNPGVDCWTAWTGAPGTVVLIPVAADKVYGWVSGDGGGRQFSETAAAFAPYPPVVRDALSAASEDTVPLWSPLEEIRPAAWTDGRIVLVGDAAHATAPVWAQGAALALEDALVLADLLTAVDWGLAGQELRRRRETRIEHVQAMTDRFARLTTLPAWVRSILAARLGERSYRATYAPLRTPVLG
jgi:2-polyprenyl-6-methoxyphenol hydroxylase-like FAD-dependent oxidoreductase